jgi:Lrp/AsnC family transcriptional regulator, regulator for asnA, asnC and gidA
MTPGPPTQQPPGHAAEVHNVDYVVVAAGRFHELMEAVCRGNEVLLALINDVIRAIAGVRAPATTFTYLHLEKQT